MNNEEFDLLMEGKREAVHREVHIDSLNKRMIMPPPSPLDTQPGGTHYKDRTIQPIEYIMANCMPYADGNVVKYVSRHRYKNGKEDILKAIHYLNFILEDEYDEGDSSGG